MGKLPKLSSLKSVHIVGVCGTLMGNFATLLLRKGVKVSGSDQDVYPPMSDVLASAGVKLFKGYAARNLDQIDPPDLVIIGNVIRRDNPEAQAVVERGLTFASLPEFMEELLLPNAVNIVCAGTHGKTTTSSLMAWTLLQAGLRPNWFIGGVVHDLKDSFHVDRVKKKVPFVLEGDEYDTAYWDKVPKFNHYLPDHALLTSIEYDHADIYPDMAAVVRAFRGLIERIRPGGHLIACWDYPHCREMVERARERKLRVITYSAESAEADYFVENYRETAQGVVFSNGRGENIRMTLHGRYNAANALAVWIEARQWEVPSDVIEQAFMSFRGVKRRQEVRAEVQGITVIDDFAHHPTAVLETLKALRQKYTGRRLVAVFEPRSATSRRKIFQQQYAQAFASAHQVWVAEPHQSAALPPADQFSSAQLVGDLNQQNLDAHVFSQVEEGVSQVKAQAKKGDVIAVLSNGGFGGFIPKLIEALKS